MAELLPLFPLPLVLFPETPLPLHIFEPRYKEMIGECLSLKRPFGVLRATDDGFVRAGCSAQILEVTKKYEDGRLDIVALGQKSLKSRTWITSARFCAARSAISKTLPANLLRSNVSKRSSFNAN